MQVFVQGNLCQFIIYFDYNSSYCKFKRNFSIKLLLYISHRKISYFNVQILSPDAVFIARNL